MKTCRLLKIAGLLGLMIAPQLNAYVQTSFFTPYDPDLRLPYPPKKTQWSFGAQFEYGDTKRGHDWDGKKVNILKMQNPTQSSITMLDAAVTGVETAELAAIRNTLRIVGAVDDRIRGNIDMTGSFEGFAATPYVRWYVPGKLYGKFSLSAYLPIKHMSVRIKEWKDLTNKTKPTPVQDLETVRLLTSSQEYLQNLITKFGSLKCDDWSSTGIGDLVLMLDWHKIYRQKDSMLKKVCLHAKGGVSVPTGEEKDENEALSYAFGNDGAWSFPFGLGLDLTFKAKIKLGIEGQLELILDNSKIRRMKTHLQQTELFLLNKGKASMDYGLTWKFYAYLQAFHCFKGFSIKAAYEYIKHDADKLKPESNEFSTVIVNTAKSLGEMHIHNIIASLNYDFFEECKDVCFKPQISLFYKIPVDARNIVSAQTFGGQLSFSF